jgi:hypothetical protein
VAGSTISRLPFGSKYYVCELVRLIAVTNNYRIVRHTIIKSKFQKFRQRGLKIARSLDFQMLIKPPCNILRSICYVNDSSRNGLDLNSWGKKLHHRLLTILDP